MREFFRFLLRGAVVGSLILSSTPVFSATAEPDDLLDLSLESLLDIEVTSVSKRAESISQAAAAISVLTSEDIRRSGVTSVPEALRMVPGLEVARMDANRWAISARSFNGVLSAKLLVLIDGRSVYTSISSGVIWDDQSLRLEDIDRIEVIRGPGGTLWGANAVNGVINIITKRAADTQGVSVSGYGGTHEAGGNARYGGKAGDDLQYRVDFRGTWNDEYQVPGSQQANDDWRSFGGGFRADWQASEADQLSFHGDVFGNRGNQDGIQPYDGLGGNLTALWSHTISERNAFQLKVYNETIERNVIDNLGTLRSQTDVEFQHDVGFDTRLPLTLTWGGNYRLTYTDIVPASFITLVPSSDKSHLLSGFVQAQLDLLDRRLALIAGTKLEYNNYTDFEYQPSFRVRATPWDGHNFWAAVSRAVRTPSRINRDLRFRFFGVVNVSGDRDFESEDLLAFEGGYRGRLPLDLSLSVSAFYFIYDDLQATRAINLLNMVMSNGMKVDTYGGEAELAWQTTSIEKVLPIKRLRVSTGYSLILLTDPELAPGNSAAGESPDFVTPKHQFKFRTHFDLPRDVEFDVLGYWVDELPGGAGVITVPHVDAYLRLDLRAAWRPIEWLELSVVGQNLTEKRHEEFTVFTDQASLIPRSVVGKVRVDF